MLSTNDGPIILVAVIRPKVKIGAHAAAILFYFLQQRRRQQQQQQEQKLHVVPVFRKPMPCIISGT
jgi:hypothetical protein